MFDTLLIIASSLSPASSDEALFYRSYSFISTWFALSLSLAVCFTNQAECTTKLLLLLHLLPLKILSLTLLWKIYGALRKYITLYTENNCCTAVVITLALFFFASVHISLLTAASSRHSMASCFLIYRSPSLLIHLHRSLDARTFKK